MFMTADMLKPGDVAVAIFHTGQTRAVLACMKAAQDRGAETIGITGQAGSPLLAHCEVGLVVGTQENTDL